MDQTKAGNLMLDGLPPNCRQTLVNASTSVDLPIGAALFKRDHRPRYVYFLKAGVASVVFSSESGTTVELSTEGNEGLLGWLYLLGPMLPEADCMMQVGGSALRIPLDVVQHEFDHGGTMRRAVLRYAQHQTILANQISACNRLHRAEARFSRWLLMVSDRLQSALLPMTQEFMSMMLGTRRTTVAEVAAELARVGAVEGRRGTLRIADRAALEARACECYKPLKARYADLSAPLYAEDGGEPQEVGCGGSAAPVH